MAAAGGNTGSREKSSEDNSRLHKIPALCCGYFFVRCESTWPGACYSEKLLLLVSEGSPRLFARRRDDQYLGTWHVLTGIAATMERNPLGAWLILVMDNRSNLMGDLS